MQGLTNAGDGRGAPYSTAYLPQRPGGDVPSFPAGLQGLHGMPLFEFAVVDPEWIFLSWEITPAQREAARLAYGDEWFSHRRLSVVFQCVSDSSTLGRMDLFGDEGRWFHRLNAPGALVLARLGFEHRQSRYELASAGPLQIPRLTPLEPEAYRELSVAYAVDLTGRLSIAAVRARGACLWLARELPEGAPAGLRHASGGLPDSFTVATSPGGFLRGGRQ